LAHAGILENEQWRFGTFLYIVTGPILLFLALGLMLPAPQGGKDSNPMLAWSKEERVHAGATVMTWVVMLAVAIKQAVTTTA
jgi:hypothetical protein